MTHNRDHIVIHSLSQPVSVREAVPGTKVRVWWFLALPVATFLVGLAC